MKDVLVTKENFKYVQSKGKQNLRFMILLFLLFLLIYSILSYFMMSELFHEKIKNIEQKVLIRVGIEIIICIFIVVQLWKYSKLGKIMFTVYALISFYSCKDLPVLFQVSLPDFQNQLLRIVFVILMIGKNILGFACMLKLYTDKRIRCIWSLYDLYEKDLVALDGENAYVPYDHDKSQGLQLINTTSTSQTLQSIHSEIEKPTYGYESKLEKKANIYLRTYTYVLLLYVYGSMCSIYMFMFVMRYYNPKDIDGMEFVQRILLLSCLFTALIWSLPAVSMFMYKRWARITIWCMAFFEMLRMVWSFPQIAKAFETQHYLLPSLMTLIIIECLRYILLYKINKKLYQNPFVKAFWNKKYQTILHKRKLANDE